MAAAVAAQAAAAVAAQAQLLGRGGSAAAQAAEASSADAAPSVYLALHNLVTEADLQSDQDYEDVRLRPPRALCDVIVFQPSAVLQNALRLRSHTCAPMLSAPRLPLNRSSLT